jgi:hypothetical protein
MIMRKVLALMLMLFVLASAVPLVGANPMPDFRHTPAYAASYIELVILFVAIVSFTIFLVRRKKVTMHSLLYLLTLSCTIAYMIVTIYGATYYIIVATGTKTTGMRITEFGYIYFAISYTTMAITIVTFAFSVYWIIRRAKLVKKL